MSRVIVEPTLTSRDVLDRLALRLPQLGHLIKSDQPLVGLALDSIDLVELLCVIESEFGVTVSDDDLTSAATVGRLAELVCCRRVDARRNQS